MDRKGRRLIVAFGAFFVAFQVTVPLVGLSMRGGIAPLGIPIKRQVSYPFSWQMYSVVPEEPAVAHVFLRSGERRQIDLSETVGTIRARTHYASGFPDEVCAAQPSAIRFSLNGRSYTCP